MLVQISKRVGCYKLAARNLRASCLRRQSAKKPVLLTRVPQFARTAKKLSEESGFLTGRVS
jgi:hypothetical protein